ncbi:hypothetical protein BJ742DRAFT_350795 [Cladochytrium replicatum]|nr:hypothetical protein BJ742DRAFT_350795 [Cladochytrium replicatum]
MLIDHFQDLSFCLLYPSIPWQTDIEWFQYFLRFVNPEHLIRDTTTLNSVFFAELASLGALLLNAFWVGYMFSRNKFRFMWTLRLLRSTLGLFATILYIPILSVFTRIMTGCGDHEGEHQLDTLVNCWNGIYLVRTIGVGVVMIVFILLVICVTLTFFEPDPKERVALSRPHSRIELLYVGCRTVLSILFIVFQHLSDVYLQTRWVLIVVCLISSILLFASYTWYIPYYHFRYACVRAMLMANFVWASICMVFTTLRPQSDIGIVFLMISPVIMLLSVFITRWRRAMIISVPVESCSNQFVIELKVRFKLENANLLFGRTHVEAFSFTSSPNKQTGLDFREQETSSKQQANRDRDESDTMALLNEVNDIYMYGVRKFPHSCFINLFIGQFYLLHLGNRSQCLASHTRAKTMSPKLDEAFLIFRRERLLHERFSGGDVIDFIAFEQNIKMAKKNEKKALIGVIKFWGELLRKHPNYRRLHDSAAQISNAVGIAREKYLAIIKLSPDNPKSYRLYGSFLINVLNDKKTGMAMLQHAEELEEVTDSPEDAEGELNVIQLMSGDCATVTVSGNPGSIGRVLEANALMTKIFGFRKAELVGFNINKIIPHPFSDHHDSFLTNYLETGMAKVVDRLRHVLGVHKDGHLIMISLAVKQAGTEGGTSYLAFIKQLPIKAGEEFIILDSAFRVLHSTAGCNSLFKNNDHVNNGRASVVSKVRDNAEQVPITEWIPDFEEHHEQYLSRAGARFELESDNRKLVIQFGSEEIAVAGKIYYVCRLRARNADDSTRSRQNSAMMADQATGCPVSRKGDNNAHDYDVDDDDDSGSDLMPMKFSPYGSSDLKSVDSRRDHPIPKGKIAALARNDNTRSSVVGRPPKLAERSPSVEPPRQIGERSPSYDPPRHQKSTDGFPRPQPFPHPFESRRSSFLEIPNRQGLQMQTPMSPLTLSNDNTPVLHSPLHAIHRAGRRGSLGAASEARSETTSATGQSSSGHGYVKSVVYKKNAFAERRLFFLYNSFLLCFLLLSALGIFNHEYYSMQLGTVAEFYDKATEIEDAARAAAKIMECSRTIDLSFDQTVAPMAPMLIDRARAATECRQNLAELVQFKMNSGQKILSDELTLEQLQGTGFSSPVVRLLDVLEAFVTAGYAVSDASNNTVMPEENFAPFRTALYTMLGSKMGILLVQALNHTGEESRDNVATVMENQGLPFMLQTALGPLLCIICFILARPIYTGIEAAREEFIHIFLDIPKEVIKGIYEANHQRLFSNEDESDEEDDELAAAALSMDKLSTDSNKDSRGGSSLQGYRTIQGFFRAYFEVSDQYHINIKWFIIFIITSAYFLTFGSLVYDWFTNYAASNSFWAQQRAILSIQISHSLRTKYVSFLNRTLGRPQRLETIWNTSVAITSLRTLDNALIYGNAAMGVGGVLQQVNEEENYLLISNGCTYNDNSTDYLGETCATWADGAMSRGLHAGVQWFLSTADDLNGILTPLADHSIPLNITTLPPDIIRRLGRVWMAAIFHFPMAFHHSAQLYKIPLFDRADSIMVFHLVTTCVYVSILALIFMFVIRPMIKSLHDDTHRFAVMLFMIPPELLQNVKSLMEWATKRDGLISLNVREKRKNDDIEKQINIKLEGGKQSDDKVRFMNISGMSMHKESHDD